MSGSAALSPPARAQTTPEYDLKAVLLHHLTQFVDWPPETETSPGLPWVIGILGHDPFGPMIDEVVRNETHLSRPIVVQRYRNIDAMRNCHVLFVDESVAADLPRIFATIKNRPILSVGDFDAFAARGGMIRFKKSPEGKIRLRINLAAIKEGGLNVSAKLLRVSEVVTVPPS